ncbi:hypothetical protein KI387_009294, partial [Taxus chinensis]
DLIEDFKAFGIHAIPRDQNQDANRLATIGSQYNIPVDIMKEGQQFVKMVVRPVVPDN